MLDEEGRGAVLAVARGVVECGATGLPQGVEAHTAGQRAGLVVLGARGVALTSLRASMLACPMRVAMTPLWPREAAKCRAVFPNLQHPARQVKTIIIGIQTKVVYLALGVCVRAVGDESGDSCMGASLRRLMQRAPSAHVPRVRICAMLQQKLSHRVAPFARRVVQRRAANIVLGFKHGAFLDEHTRHVVMPELRGIMQGCSQELYRENL